MTLSKTEAEPAGSGSAANLEKLSKLIRYYILTSTTEAGSGHPTSSLSAVELTSTLLFGGYFMYDLKNKNNPFNDRLIFSKGHAAPLLYSLFAAAGAISEDELMTLRKFGSRLEGHPTLKFPYTEAPTGSLGHGLSIGLGMALNSKYLDKTGFKTFVLMGDSEMAEGSVWEAMGLASFHELDNLTGILDVNRLGQSRETMLGHNLAAWERRISSFGWDTVVVEDGHNTKQVISAYNKIQEISGKPVMIIAKTFKGRGVSFLEDREGWHGKALSPEQLKLALSELGDVDKNIRGNIKLPEKVIFSCPQPAKSQIPASETSDSGLSREYPIGSLVTTRKAYGNALANLFHRYPNIVVMDAETSNSSYAEYFAQMHPQNYIEMFLAEQTMAGVALGLSMQGKIPCISTFAVFHSRAHDQIRMAQYAGADANIKFCGSHSGTATGEDGSSHMALEDIAMFRSIPSSVILYPADAVSAEKLTGEAVRHRGMVYIRTTRKDTPVIYGPEEKFPIGGSKILRESPSDLTTVVSAGITLHEALKAADLCRKNGIPVRVIDAYSINPLDTKTLREAAEATRAVITVEDHYRAGGLGEAVSAALSDTGRPVNIMAVEKPPQSGKPEELLAYEGINAEAIYSKVVQLALS